MNPQFLADFRAVVTALDTMIRLAKAHPVPAPITDTVGYHDAAAVHAQVTERWKARLT